jgi:predicted DNA binding CopG/RHH family protein
MEGLDPETKGRRLFSLLPLKNGFSLSHIMIARTELDNILKMIPGEFRDEEHAEDIWRRLFDFEQYETKNRKFAYLLTTDGYTASLRFQKPMNEEKVKKKAKFKEKNDV